MVTPWEFVVDVLLMRRDRHLSEETACQLGYPLAGPLVVQDWTQVTPLILPEAMLLSVSNLKALLVQKLDEAYCCSDLILQSVYLSVGQGLLMHGSQPPAQSGYATPSGDTGSFQAVTRHIGLAMNVACSLRNSGMSRDGPSLALCVLLGAELFAACCEHSNFVLRHSFELGAAGRGVVFKGIGAGLQLTQHETGGFRDHRCAWPAGPEDPCGVGPGRQRGTPQFYRSVRRAVEGPGGVATPLHVRHEDGQAGTASPTGTPEGSDLAFLAVRGRGPGLPPGEAWLPPAQGHWGLDLPEQPQGGRGRLGAHQAEWPGGGAGPQQRKRQLGD